MQWPVARIAPALRLVGIWVAGAPSLGPRPTPAPAQAAVATALYDEFNNADTVPINSRQYEAGFAESTDQIADDFVVPYRSTWSVSRVDVATAPVTMVGPTPTTVFLLGLSASVGLTVHRVTAGLPATVELMATDGCRPWPTCVGGGPRAF
jgi:hypothetical protein